MQRISLDAEAGQVSAELVRRGIASDTRVHVLVEVTSEEELPMAAMARLEKPSIGWRRSRICTPMRT
jgi:hypothetical protein